MTNRAILALAGAIVAGAASCTAMGDECQKPPGAVLGGGEGSVSGIVAEKGHDWITIKPVNGSPDQAIKFVPMRFDGDCDPSAVKAIAAARVGDIVQIRYAYGDGLYIIKLTCAPPCD